MWTPRCAHLSVFKVPGGLFAQRFLSVLRVPGGLSAQRLLSLLLRVPRRPLCAEVSPNSLIHREAYRRGTPTYTHREAYREYTSLPTHTGRHIGRFTLLIHPHREAYREVYTPYTPTQGGI